MKLFERLNNEGYEQVIFCNDKSVGLKAIIAIHDSTLGPGTGGCRMYPYQDEEAALEDVLRLSKGMTYKAAISGLKLGGAKAVIIGDSKTQKSKALLQRFGQFVEGLKGRYITAKDVGINGEDLKIVQGETKHVLGIEGLVNSSGDPSPLTAWGVYNGIKACAKHVYGDDSLKGKRIAVQGLGYVSYFLVNHLVKEGAQVVGADIDPNAVGKFKAEFGIETVGTDEILYQDCDILSPNAMGGVLNSVSIPRIQAKIIAGAANNQLAKEEYGYDLMTAGKVYAPDYAINAGGLMNIYHELDGYDSKKAHEHVAGIYKTIAQILERSQQEKLPTHLIANRIAEERIQAGRK